MNTLLQGFLDNDSFFGRFMTKLGIIIAANILFVIGSIPFFTLGASLAALYHVMLRTLRSGGVVNPFKEFWKGFKSNFRQATVTWLLFVGLLAFFSVDLQICSQAGGMLAPLAYGIGAAAIAVVILFFFMIPVMAAFEARLGDQVRNALFFLMKKPWKSIVILFFDIFPLVLTYSDLQNLPLYAFVWTLCGFGLQAMLASTLLLPEFTPFLPSVDGEGKFVTDLVSDPGSDEDDMMQDLRELDGF